MRTYFASAVFLVELGFCLSVAAQQNNAPPISSRWDCNALDLTHSAIDGKLLIAVACPICGDSHC